MGGRRQAAGGRQQAEKYTDAVPWHGYKYGSPAISYMRVQCA
jgi:hypothetical protein